MKTTNDLRDLKIKVILAVLGLDLQEIASALGEDRGNLAKMLQGRRPAIRLRRRFAEVLCQRIEELLFEAKAKAQPETV